MRVGLQRHTVLVPGGEDGHEVVGQQLGLTHRVLGGGGAGGLGVLGGQVRDGGAVAGGPGSLDRRAVARHLEGGQRGDTAAGVDGQVGGGLQHRGGLDAGGPYDGVGVELGAVGQDDVAVDAGVEEGVEPHVDATLAQLLEPVAGELLGELGQDAARALDEDEADVALLDGRDGAHGRACHVLELGDGLDAREASSDEDEGEQAPAALGVPGGGGVLDAGEDPVAQGGGLLDLLEAHGLLRQAGDRQGAGLGAQGNDEVVVGQGVGLDPLVRGLGGRGTHGDGAARVVDGGDGAGDDGDAVEVTAVGGDDVARLDGAGRDLRQEGLVGHVGARVDDGDLDLVEVELGAQGPGDAEADVAATGDDDAGRTAAARAGGDVGDVVAGRTYGQCEGGSGGQEAGGRQGNGGATTHGHNLRAPLFQDLARTYFLYMVPVTVPCPAKSRLHRPPATTVH